MKECMERILIEINRQDLHVIRHDPLVNINVNDKERLIAFIEREFELAEQRNKKPEFPETCCAKCQHRDKKTKTYPDENSRVFCWMYHEYTPVECSCDNFVRDPEEY